MKAILNFLVLPCLLITPIAVDLMQTGGPHGGVLKKSNNYYIEMKTVDNFFYTYLLDGKQKVISSKNLSCNVRFFLADSTDLILQLKPFDNGFKGENIQGYRYCKITFNVDEKTTESALFENQKPVVNKE